MSEYALTELYSDAKLLSDERAALIEAGQARLVNPFTIDYFGDLPELPGEPGIQYKPLAMMRSRTYRFKEVDFDFRGGRGGTKHQLTNFQPRCWCHGPR